MTHEEPWMMQMIFDQLKVFVFKDGSVEFLPAHAGADQGTLSAREMNVLCTAWIAASQDFEEGSGQG